MCCVTAENGRPTAASSDRCVRQDPCADLTVPPKTAAGGPSSAHGAGAVIDVQASVLGDVSGTAPTGFPAGSHCSANACYTDIARG
jgi:hypothetical protein